MDTERVRRGGTRARHQAEVARGGWRTAVLLVPIAVGALMLLPRGPFATTAGAPGTPLESLANEIQGPVATQLGARPRSPFTIEQIRTLYAVEAAKARFDSTLLGWRIAAYDALKSEGISDRNLIRSCEPHPAGAETPTQLDFTVGYLPPEFKIGPVEGPMKWLCGDEVLSVLYVYNVATALGAGQLWFERSITGRRVLEMDVPEDSVEAAMINGTPAIIVHPADDATGLGMGRVVIIEDDSGPEFTILSITADEGVPFVELVKIAEGIK